MISGSPEPDLDRGWSLVKNYQDEETYRRPKRGQSRASTGSHESAEDRCSLTEAENLLPRHFPRSPSIMMNSDVSFKSFYVPSTAERPSSPKTEMNDFQVRHGNTRTAISARPLNRFLEEIESVSEFSEDAEMIEQEWKKLLKLRASVLRHRAKLRSKRNEVRKSQLAKDKADDAFMKYVRGHVSPRAAEISSTLQQGAGQNLSEIFASLQETRDHYGPIADSYDLLEDRVDEEEFEMAKLEVRLYKTKLSGSGMNAENTEEDPTSNLQPALSDSLLSGSEETPQEYHPLHANYLSKVGDLDLAMEQYRNMIQEYENLASIQRTRHTVGLELDEVGIEILGTFSVREAASLREIETIEEEIEIVKAKCLEEGIKIDESSHGSHSGDIEYGSDTESKIVDVELSE